MPDGAIERLDAVNARDQETPATPRPPWPAARDRQAGVRRVEGQRRAVASGCADRGPQGARALDRPIAGPDRRVGDEIGQIRPSWPPRASGWDWKADMASLPALSAKKLVVAAVAGQAAAAVPPALARTQQAAAAAHETAESLSQQIESALAARGQARSGVRHGPGGQSGLAVPPPRADRRAARPIGPPSDRIGGARPAFGRPPTAADRRAGRTRRGVRRRRGVDLGRAVPAGLDYRLGRLGHWPCWVWPASSPPPAARVLLERSNAHQLEACQKQLGVLPTAGPAGQGRPRRAGCPIAAAAAARSPAGCKRPNANWRPWRSWRRWTRVARGPAGGGAAAAHAQPRRRANRRRPAGVGGRLAWRPPACRKTSPRAGPPTAQNGERIAETQRRLAQRREELCAGSGNWIAFAARSFSLRPRPACRSAPSAPSSNCGSLPKRPPGRKRRAPGATPSAARHGGCASARRSTKRPSDG